MGRRGRRVRNVASAVHHTDTTNEPWDGGAATRAMPNEAAVLNYCHAWHEDNAGDIKGNYKFPHHETDGGPAFLAACRNGLSRLDQADIPSGDRDGVRAHLQAHLDDANGGDSEDRHRPPVAARSLDRIRARVRALHPDASRPDAATAVRFWDTKAAASPDAADELWIYDQIGFVDWLTGEGVTAQTFAKDLSQLKAKNLTLRINSPGGDVFDGLAIKNMIASHARDRGVRVTARVDALAASIASVIIQAADEVIVEPHSQIMIHDASGFSIGNASEMREMADLLDMISQNIAQVYADAAGGSPDAWRKTMKAETWYTAREAVNAGLADKVGAAGPGRKSKCTSCDGTGEADGKTCADCNGTGRVKPVGDDESAPEDARRLRVAAQWCARLFPGHERAFENVLAEFPAAAGPEDDPADPAPPTPAAPVVSSSTAAPAAVELLTETDPIKAEDGPLFEWDASALTGAVRAATAPPQIDLGDWRSFFSEAPAMPEPERNALVDLGPAPARPAPAPDPARAPLAVGVDLGDWRNAFAAAPAVPEQQAPGPVDLGPAPARPAPAPDPVRNPLAVGVDLGDWRNAFAEAPAVPEQQAPGPVDLGPAPARPAPAPDPVRNPLAEAIVAAVDITAKTQPEPPAPMALVHELPELPTIRLDVDGVRRAVREARF